MTYLARKQGLDAFLEPLVRDMSELDWKPASLDLLWCEGAAYNMGFENALKAWRPLMAENGVAMISEMNYFTDDIPEAVAQYMAQAYPDIKTEPENIALITSAEFEVLASHRLPSQAWWDNYYNPLTENIKQFKGSDDEVMQQVIEETEQEMAFFREHSDTYGYTYYLMKAV